ncbi:MAG: hypothetical protein EA398_12610 [Deltaproteobacteria bacterium]|nr:MAG: hypothetical protein EA398_12610 [Deltaproteobacteria bacterium]
MTDLLDVFDLRHGAARVAVVGVAKNAGKTTTLCALLDALDRAGSPPPGLLSVGVDGERHDAFSGAAKPAIQVHAGTICATAEQAVGRSTARLDLLEDTGITTPMGRLFLARVHLPGELLLAGVRHRADLHHLTARMHALGASRILIDGAFDRLIAAEPTLTDGVLLATGAVAGSTPQEVARCTRDLVDRMRLPAATPALVARLPRDPEHRILVLHDEGTTPLEAETLLRPLPQLAHLLRQHRPDAIIVPGALTPRGADHLLAAGLRHTPLVLPDATHALLRPGDLRRLSRRGIELTVQRTIRVLGLSLNPVAPGGVHLESTPLAHALQEALPDLPILDVRTGLHLPPTA